MDGLRLPVHQISDSRECKFSSPQLLNYSSIARLLVTEDNQKNLSCAAGTIEHLKNENFGDKAQHLKSGFTTLPRSSTEAFLTSKRKHEDMSLTTESLANGEDRSLLSTYRKQTRLSFSLSAKDNAADKAETPSNDRRLHATWLEYSTAKVIIPENCGDSGLTVEHYMAESSKSSCFDDPCTLTFDSVATGAESAMTSTGLLQQFDQELTKHKVSDLNLPLQHIKDHENAYGDENDDQSIYSNKEKLNSSLQLHLNKNEDFTQAEILKPQTPETVAASPIISGETCTPATDNESWLQLGLGIGHNYADLSKITEALYASVSPVIVADSSTSTKDQKLLRLLQLQSEPSTAVNYTGKDLSTYSSIKGAGVGSSSRSGEADEAFRRITFIAPGISKQKKVLMHLGHESIGYGESAEGSLELPIMAAAKNTSEPHRKVSSLASRGDYASITTSGLPTSYMHLTRSDQHPRMISRMSNLISSSLPPPPAACDENLGLFRSNVALQQAYQLPASDGRIDLSQSYSDQHVQLRKTINSRPVGASVPIIPQGNQNNMLWRPQGWLQSFQNRPESFAADQDKVAVSVTGESGRTSVGKIERQQILSQEWQQLAKRIGTNMNFQSIISEGTSLLARNSPFQHAIEELQLAALQHSNYAAQNNYFRIPSSNPTVPPTGARDDPVYITKRSNLLSYNGCGISSNLPASGNDQTYRIEPRHGPLEASIYEHTQRPAAYNAVSAEKLKLTRCCGDKPGLWFMLQASDNPYSRHADSTLPQIPKGYLRVKDEKVLVTYVKKYLADKLGLACESEVEIACKGKPLDSSLSLEYVRDAIWFPHTSLDRTCNQEEEKVFLDNPRDLNFDPRDVVMVLTYVRKLPSM